MESYLKRLDLQDVIKGFEKYPGANDNFAQSEIILNVANKQLHIVENQQLANAMWEFLKMKYSHTDLPKQVPTHLKKLTSLTLKETEGVETFLDTWKTQLDEVILSRLP